MLNRLRLALGRRPIAPAHAEPPEGEFEFRGGRCVGTVIDKFHPPKLPLVVFVQTRELQVLQEVAVPCATRHRSYNFAFELDGRVAPRDLLTDQVSLFVENAFGVRSKLILDGASQLTLIREYFGKPRSVLFDLDFTKGGNAGQYMRGGWSGMEPKVCCSDGPEALLEVPAALRSGDRYELTISCYPFLFPPQIAEQRLVLTLNGFPQRGALDAKYMEFFNFIFPPDSLADADVATLKFEFPDCFAPAEFHQNQDKRRLSFGFKQLTLVRLLPLTRDK